MFKKTLLALALTGLAGTATAGTVDAGADKTKTGFKNNAKAISVEGAAAITSAEMTAVDFTVDENKVADYKSLKTIVVNVTGATLSPATAAKLAIKGTALPCDTSATPVVACQSPVAADELDSGKVVVSYPTSTQVKFELLATGNEAFVDFNSDGLTAGDEFTISGLDLVFASKDAGSKVSFEVIAQSSVGGSTIDSGTGVVAEFVEQFDVEVSTKMTKQINVGAERKVFVGTDAAAQKTAQAEVEFSNLSTDLGVDLLLPAAVESNTYNYTLNGDFSFLDVDGDDKIDSEFELSGTAAKGLQSTTFKDVNVNSATFDLVTDGSVVLPVQGYNIDASFDYTSAGKTETFTANGLSAGSWSLNGSGGNINFMPFGSQYAQSITITNRGSVVGDIDVVLGFQGETFSTTLTAKAAAKSITDISKEVAAFAAESGVVGNATVDVIVAAPSTTVDAIYYAKKDADRVKVK